MFVMTEKDPVEARKQIVQEVIDRTLKYGQEYEAALKALNEKFPVAVVQRDYRSYPKEKN